MPEPQKLTIHCTPAITVEQWENKALFNSDCLKAVLTPTFQLILLPCLSARGDNVCSESQKAVSPAFGLLRMIKIIVQLGKEEGITNPATIRSRQHFIARA